MTVRDLELLFDYGYWAHRRLLRAASELTDEEFTREVAGSYGSVRNTLVHILSAEWGWLERCGGPARGPKLSPVDYPTLASLTETWTRVEGRLRAFLAGLEEKDLTRVIEFDDPRGGGKSSMAVGEMLRHAAIHGVHHRGQVALLLRVLGHAAGNFDMILYDAERRNTPLG
jgi:uncharacterized damage-inducible protein DinB